MTLVLLFATLLSSGGDATVFRGTVHGGGTVAPGVTLMLTGNGLKTTYAISDAAGRFNFDVPRGTYCLRAELSGFESVESEVKNSGMDVDIQLTPALVQVVTVNCVLPNYMNVVVTDPQGKPVEHAELVLT